MLASLLMSISFLVPPSVSNPGGGFLLPHALGGLDEKLGVADG